MGNNIHHLSAPQRRAEEQRRRNERKKAAPPMPPPKKIAAPATGPLFPHVHVQLTGADGNAMVIVGKVRRALDKHGVSGDVAETFVRQALSGDYDHVIQTCMRWVDVS